MSEPKKSWIHFEFEVREYRPNKYQVLDYGYYTRGRKAGKTTCVCRASGFDSRDEAEYFVLNLPY